jgi:hypothetical protein
MAHTAAEAAKDAVEAARGVPTQQQVADALEARGVNPALAPVVHDAIEGAKPVAPPASAPLGWTSSPGDRGKDAVTTPESSRTGTTDPALVGPARGTTDRGVQTQYAKGITEAALRGVGRNTTQEEAIARGRAAQAEMAKAGIPAPIARAALTDLANKIAAAMGYARSDYLGLVGSKIDAGVNQGMRGYQVAPPGPVQGPPSLAPAQEATAPLDLTGDPGGLQYASRSGEDHAPGLLGFDQTSFAPSTYSTPDLSGDPGGLQGAVPGFNPAQVAPTIDLPTITNEKDAPVDYEGPAPLVSQNEAPGLFAALSGTQGDSLEGFVRLLAEGLSMQAGMPADEAMQMVLAAAHRLIEEQGLSTEKALQVVAQSMQTQMAA